GDYYASCMDTQAIERAGLASIKPLLDKAQHVKDARSWMTALVELHKVGIPVVWNEAADADFKDSATAVTELDAGGLGLPDRDYYVKPMFKDKLDAYRAHVARMLALAGTPPAKVDAAAGDVVAIESELAKLTKTSVEQRDPQAAYNAMDAKGLAKLTRSIDWKAYFKALGVAPSAKIVVGTPKYFAALDGLRTRFKPAQWASYFTYQLLEHQAIALPQAFDDEAFALDKAITGQPEKADRAKRCVAATASALGELLGQQYVAKYFPAQAKQAASNLVEAIDQAMSGEIAQLDWMSDATKQVAEHKLATVSRMVGYPERWRSYDFDVRRDDFGGDLLRAQAFEHHHVMARAGKPVDRGEWRANVFEVDAYYEPTANSTAILAGGLQPPFFGLDRAVAANLGGTGMIIGHELTHGFDDQGAQFDASGNLASWWQPADKAAFDAKARCVADQYQTFEAAPGQFVNGRLTLGEDIADLGGVKMAFLAYRALRKGAAKTYVADGFTEDQQFFLAVGQAWCAKYRPEELLRFLTSDPHAPAKFRVYGMLRNFPAFAQAWSCAPGTPMHPAKTCAVW
ncbi:MAG TPA: M13 family metallopeptidase, partial [Kofleriaceae bacterium]|nr:M13 family metallopeptidase [Kofleriaceae bacterium]